MIQDREALLSVASKSGYSIKDLFNEITEPVILMVPQLASKDEYLIILKEFNKEDDLTYTGILTIKKDATIKNLY